MYRQAAKLDESNAQAIQGTIRCKLLQGKLDEAAEQLEFYNAVVADTMGKSPSIAYLNAQLAIRKGSDSGKSVELLDDVTALYWKDIASCAEPRNSFAWIARLDVDTLVQNFFLPYFSLIDDYFIVMLEYQLLVQQQLPTPINW